MDNQKSYCLKCKKEVTPDIKKCECGNKSFVFGDIYFKDEKLFCVCGNTTFKTNMHLDYSDKAVTSYECNKCGKVVVTEHYRKFGGIE